MKRASLLVLLALVVLTAPTASFAAGDGSQAKPTAAFGNHPGNHPGNQPGTNYGDQALYRTAASSLQNAQFALRNRDYRRAYNECSSVETSFRYRTSPLDRQILAGVQRVMQGIKGGNYPAAMAQLNGLARTVQDAANGSSWGNGGNNGWDNGGHHPSTYDPYETNRRLWAQDVRGIIVDVRDGRFDNARRGLDRLISAVARAAEGTNSGIGYGQTNGSHASPRLRELGRRLRFVAQGLQGWNPNRRETIDQLRQIRRELDGSAIENW